MSKLTDVQVVGTEAWLIPIRTRVPLKFGRETLSAVNLLRVRVRVRTRDGREALGWGETPLSVQWGWPSTLSYQERLEAMVALASRLTRAWPAFEERGHPVEIGWDFVEHRLGGILGEENARRGGEAMPWLAALITASAYDLAIHDAYGQVLGQPVYATYTGEFLNRDLAAFLEAEAGYGEVFRGKFPADFLVVRRDRLRAWHLVGGVDPVAPSESQGVAPEDGYPVLLDDWIRRDGLSCLKIKLRGNDAEWDYRRLVTVGFLACAAGVDWLSADFNCTVTEPAYVNQILDQLRDEHPRIYGMLLYVEQPFPYELETTRMEVRSVS
ncbi:MAG: hypothetical protein IT580_16870, partial [Verrucomicrobiales bacterium]|nr:hypothetical protein [Verrucomicrobiales bacterium]